MTETTQGQTLGPVEVVTGECGCDEWAHVPLDQVDPWEHRNGCGLFTPVAYRAQIFERCPDCEGDSVSPCGNEYEDSEGSQAACLCHRGPLPGHVPVDEVRCSNADCGSRHPYTDEDGCCKTCGADYETGHAYATMTIERYGEVLRACMKATDEYDDHHFTALNIVEPDVTLARAITNHLYPKAEE